MYLAADGEVTLHWQALGRLHPQEEDDLSCCWNCSVGSGSLYLGDTIVFSWLDLLDPFVDPNHLLSTLVSHVYALKVKYVF